MLGGYLGAVGGQMFAVSLSLSVVSLFALVSYARSRTAVAPASIVVATAIAFAIVVRGILLPTATSWFISTEASSQLQRDGLHPRLSPHAGRLIAVGYGEPSFVFLTRTDTLLATPDQAAAVARPNSAMIVEGRQRIALNRALAPHHLMFAPVGDEVQGFDYSNHRTIALQPGRILISQEP